MKQYEYKSFNRKLYDSDLNELGSQGWELVAHTGVMCDNLLSQYYVFKREKQHVF